MSHLWPGVPALQRLHAALTLSPDFVDALVPTTTGSASVRRLHVRKLPGSWHKMKPVTASKGSCLVPPCSLRLLCDFSRLHRVHNKVPRSSGHHLRHKLRITSCPLQEHMCRHFSTMSELLFSHKVRGLFRWQLNLEKTKKIFTEKKNTHHPRT